MMNRYAEIVDNILLKKDISESRKVILESLSNYIAEKLPDNQNVKLTFICTHNSRRSHLAQIWAHAAAHYYDLKPVKCYSGGTETTAFHPNAIQAIQSAGFEVDIPSGYNPEVTVHVPDSDITLSCFSKVYDHPSNPTEQFAAIMVCSDADEHCPFIPGAEKRISLPYEDPKISDGSGDESEVYRERSEEIAKEMFWVMKKAKDLLSN